MGAQFSNRASSLRFTGAPNDWNYDTINMYFNEYFIGDEEFTYTDAPVLNYPNRAQSIVVRMPAMDNIRTGQVQRSLHVSVSRGCHQVRSRLLQHQTVPREVGWTGVQCEEGLSLQCPGQT